LSSKAGCLIARRTDEHSAPGAQADQERGLTLLALAGEHPA
jgi:hypothetical protein